VETANLDGENNLKTKFICSPDLKIGPDMFWNLQGRIVLDRPNSHLYEFNGLLQIEGLPEHPIQFDNFLLRETVLRNATEVVGVVVYTGYDTKIVQNQGNV
jgi:phospholipid-translocating ATPase